MNTSFRNDRLPLPVLNCCVTDINNTEASPSSTGRGRSGPYNASDTECVQCKKLVMRQECKTKNMSCLRTQLLRACRDSRSVLCMRLARIGWGKSSSALRERKKTRFSKNGFELRSTIIPVGYRIGSLFPHSVGVVFIHHASW